jgi:PhzF family phenazine biosynthesis protein
MQNIATEIGFSETAFIKELSQGVYDIRFYTPKQEIALCGHATLASAKIILDTVLLDRVTFVNRDSIELKVSKIEGRIAMEFPVYDTIEFNAPPAILSALGIDSTINTRYSQKNKIVLLEIADSEHLRNLRPDFQALLDSYSGINGVLVTALSDDKNFDFQYRYFWPWAGTNEDPVTGGVQTFLTRYWATKLNKTRLESFQSSSRTGVMTTELVNGKVVIYGTAVVVFEGNFID